MAITDLSNSIWQFNTQITQSWLVVGLEGTITVSGVGTSTLNLISSQRNFTTMGWYPLEVRGLYGIGSIYYTASDGWYYKVNGVKTSCSAPRIEITGGDVTNTTAIAFLTANATFVAGNYPIVPNLTGLTYLGDTQIYSTGTATGKIVANANYGLPASITVTGANYSYNSTTGGVTLFSATGQVTITATGELLKWQITYNSNGGTQIAPQIDATVLPTPMPTPTKTDYIFMGWYYDNDTFLNPASAGDAVTGNVTVYAKWAVDTAQVGIEIVQQLYITKYLKIEVLNFDYTLSGEISGNCLSCSVNVDANSDIRRTCSVSFVVTDDTYLVKPGSNVWLDKYIRLSVGYLHTRSGDVMWYNQGIFLIDEPSWQYNATTNEVSFKGVDLMAKLTGLRNGTLPTMSYQIAAGSNVRSAMISTLALAGITRYVISECQSGGVTVDTTYDIAISRGSSVYNLLAELRDVVPNYQIYFDVNGVFHYEPIPTDSSAPVSLDDSLLGNIIIDQTINSDFSAVKNSIEVYGHLYDTDNWATSITYSALPTLSMTVASISTLTSGTLLGFQLSQDVGNIAPSTPYAVVTDEDLNVRTYGSVSGENLNLTIGRVVDENLILPQYQTLKIAVNGGVAYPIQQADGTPITALSKDLYYIVIFRGTYWEYVGQRQIYYKIEDTNTESPFYVEGSVGRICLVLSGGDYDNIMTEDLARQQAEMELFWRCRLNDSISLSVVPVPWLDVNLVMEHSDKKYIIQSYSVDYGKETGTMSITASSMYE